MVEGVRFLVVEAKEVEVGYGIIIFVRLFYVIKERRARA